MTMEFSEKNIEMTKMMARIEQLDIENQNLVRLLETQKSEYNFEEDKQSKLSEAVYEKGKQFSEEEIEDVEEMEGEEVEDQNIDNYDLFNENVEEWEEYPNENEGF
jgi:hypothetical protein